MARIRCPKCSHIFAHETGAPLCPSCGFSGSVAGTPAPAPRRKPKETSIPFWVPIVIFAVIVLAIGGIIFSQFQDDGTAADDAQFAADVSGDANDGPEDTSGFTPEPEQDPAQYGELQDDAGSETASVQFANSGTGQTGAFSVNGGVLRVQMTHFGQDQYFSLKFWTTDQMELPLEDRGTPAGVLGAPSGSPGAYDGIRYVGLNQGSYQIDVTADGSWSITIDFPSAEAAVDGSEGITGEGPDGPPPMVLGEGDHNLRWIHEGEGEFSVRVWDWQGKLMPPSETGCFAFYPEQYDRTKECRIPMTGPYFFDVEASGAYSIRSV